MYSLIYRLIQKILVKRSFYDDFLKILNQENINHIVEIGCADSMILQKLDKKYSYDGYDIDNNFILRSKKKYENYSKYNFLKESIHKINFDKYDNKKTIILLVGIFHHVNDELIKIFLDKTKFFKVYAIDAVRLDNQNLFTKLLLNLDRGNFIRFENQYKELLIDYDFILARNKYLNFKYDHLISVKNINIKNIETALNS
jgi:16S rRNA A1518/A1519 N6-dimethyltransferase RsmA/KsgA/DIM1 with predicted DNA glycosylase/AP lyase activity